MKICIIGHSKRLSVLEKNLKNRGLSVDIINSAEELDKEIKHDVVVLPVPSVNKLGFANLEGDITIESLLENINLNSLIISCGYTNPDYKIIDLNEREDFAYLNVVPTAEGAIFVALSNSELSLFESKILITGFGRVAKLLADRLRCLCKKVTVSARSAKDLAFAEALSYNALPISSLKNHISEYDIIFQTVPVRLLIGEIIDNMTKNSIIIELSSKSLGTDHIYAESKGINVVHAPALPEKISPVSAGNILTKSVLSIISEQKGSVYSE